MQEDITYWAFKHKPGTDGSFESILYVEKALKLKSAIMQYEYGYQDQKKVTQNWKRLLDIKIGDIIFLRGDTNIHAYGVVIKPRKEPDEIISIDKILNNPKSNQYRSDKYSGCISFEESDVFYEDLAEGEQEWGQRIDVDNWHFFHKKGIYAQSKEYYLEGESDYGVLKQMKNIRAKEIMSELENAKLGKIGKKAKDLLYINKNLILTGAPGTGKTYLAREIAKTMNAEIEFVQFHPSYDYTDFVEGLRPIKKGGSELSFDLKDGIFKRFCKLALKNLLDSKKTTNNSTKKNFVLIIDEINRAEISKVFGELFFSIDPGYRGEKGRVKTQYSNLLDVGDVFYDGFFIPENVYIIGTMNDIDRSVESFDFAMRRRFAWQEIKAKDRIIMWNGVIDKWKKEAFKRMDSLNSKIESIQGLGTVFHIAPAYFLNLEKYSGDFDRLWENHLKGVLFEYLRGLPNNEDSLKDLKSAYDTPIEAE